MIHEDIHYKNNPITHHTLRLVCLLEDGLRMSVNTAAVHDYVKLAACVLHHYAQCNKHQKVHQM